MIKRPSLVALAVVGVVASGCGGGTATTVTVPGAAPAAATVTVTEPAPMATAPDATTTTARKTAATGRTERKLRQTGIDGGLTIRINRVRRIPRLDHLKPTNNYPSSKTPGAGAEFIEVDGTVLNSGKVPIDPWCSYAIVFTLVDSKDRNYSPIDDLYRIPGNVDCNYEVQPGFRMAAHVVFRVPVGIKASGVAVFDPNQKGDPNHASYVWFGL